MKLVSAGLGYRKDRKDKRDFGLYGFYNDRRRASDLSLYIRGRFDQGPTNTCVTNAIDLGVCMRDVMAGREWQPYSRLFPYWYGRSVFLRLIDIGSRPRDVFRAWNRMGSPLETEWPFDPAKVTTRPPALVRRLAVDRRIEYRRCFGVDSVARALSDGYPVAFGLQIDRAFQDNRGPDVIDSLSGERSGGHMVLIVANDPERRAMRIVNSWGRGWRDDGTAWISWDVIEKEATDLWAII